MSAIIPTAAWTTSHYNQSELRPFSNRLVSYVDYAALLQKLRSAAKTLFVMNRVLKRSPKLRAARSAARAEMQNIYDHVAFRLGLPRVPICLSLRKRPSIRGAAALYRDGRQEIRIFPISGTSKKSRLLWVPSDIGIVRPEFICEVLLHEMAHVHETVFGGVSDHEHTFVQSYLAIEQVMLGFGFGPLLLQELRFAGCGMGTFATSLYATPRPKIMTR
jgi:hypothetical protein